MKDEGFWHQSLHFYTMTCDMYNKDLQVHPLYSAKALNFTVLRSFRSTNKGHKVGMLSNIDLVDCLIQHKSQQNLH